VAAGHGGACSTYAFTVSRSSSLAHPLQCFISRCFRCVPSLLPLASRKSVVGQQGNATGQARHVQAREGKRGVARLHPFVVLRSLPLLVPACGTARSQGGSSYTSRRFSCTQGSHRRRPNDRSVFTVVVAPSPRPNFPRTFYGCTWADLRRAS